MIPVHVDEITKEAVRLYCKRNGKKMSPIIREMIEVFVYDEILEIEEKLKNAK